MTPSPSTQRTRAARRALRPAAWAAMTATAVFALTACGGGSDPLAENSGDAASGGSSDAVTVGSADFPESQVIAELYAGVLRDAGVTVETKPGIGAREAYVGAVKDGSVDVVPDYSGNLLLFADKDATAASAEDIMKALPSALEGQQLSVLDPSRAENKDALVVTQATAEKYGLTSIEDLSSVCGDLIMAGPPEFQERAYGVDGLKQKYDCSFKSFQPINDGGGPLTVQALTQDDAQVADIFTTTPAIQDQHLTVLEDPKNNFIAQQVLPLTAPDRLPQNAVDALNEFSTKLTTQDLIDLNRKVSGDQQQNPADAAKQWLSDHGYEKAS
ncbi:MULTISPECIES: ABC transporter substrate-binding protein [Kocuria]|uniref:Osmoprotectant transport system substrate-binding protein n=2 Tax=Kocuria TaxID=57493 RepID=A0A1X7DZQ9_9MICC|nr:glycine/betaine ABC transporter substrate-binding protein [Kocuria indica]QBJ20460.1 ABC transporter substrate-binding protein [Kocuria indica]RLP56907.1 ABC transporter substrate-binding protein [Kocuria indica]SMF24738.1 osmoprotectant transport system substrate-binding protein [Kocuria indica]